jgi:hypothetical protein
LPLLISVLPILLTIFVGYLVAVSGAPPRDRWDAINTLSFRILIPAILIRSIATSNLSLLTSGMWMLVLLLALTMAAGVALALRFVFSFEALPNPSFSTLFQTTTRWNAFIALVAAEQFVGPKGIALLALGMAVLIPIINVANIIVLVMFGAARTSATAVVRAIIQNPLVIGCVIGLVLNLSGAPLSASLVTTLDLIGRAALGVGLLAVGAGVELKRLLDVSWEVGLGVFLRLCLCPLAFLALAFAFRLDLDETLAGVLIFAVPAAANGYVVAQRMGGDADLYADILTWQTILSLGLLPLLAFIVHQIF